MAQRIEIDPRLDRMYVHNIRCPYCKDKILKYTTTCSRCGVTKKQILKASNKRAKEAKKKKTGGVIFTTCQRPDDVSFTKMALLLIPGIFGTYNFYVGRKIRGWIMLGGMIIGMVGFFFFSWRAAFEDWGWPYPPDFGIVLAFILWAYDAFAIVFGFYKYPIRLGEAKNEGKKNEKG